MRARFFDVLDAQDKGHELRTCISGQGNTGRVYNVDVALFAGIPGAQFSYSIPTPLLAMATARQVLANCGFQARQGFGAATRFHRLRWEVPAQALGFRRVWADMAHGTKPALAYKATAHVVRWDKSGAEAKADVCHRYPYLNGNFGFKIQSEELYGVPGLAYGKRTNRFTCQILPAGHVFSFEGTAIHASHSDDVQILAALGVLNSKVAAYWLNKTCAQHKAYNYVNDIPWPQGIPAKLASTVRRAWSHQYSLDTRTEHSHAFRLPALLQAEGHTLVKRVQSWGRFAAKVQADLEALSAELDDHAYRLYGISAEDRERIEQVFSTSGEDEESPDDDDGDESDADGDVADVDAMPMVASLLSWTLGVAFGRFDVRVATGEREAPPEPEPFDPLTACSPGMLTGDDGLPVAAPPAGYSLTFPTDGILVDDPGHPRDLVRAVRSVFDTVFPDTEARWHEAAELLGTRDLRNWFARDFFDSHIKRYSKSRRKAPIYWQLATASGSYSLWIYIHRATSDTLFLALDLLDKKHGHERSKLDTALSAAGSNPTAEQRREIERLREFVSELQALKIEVARVAPLWRPNLDDGVILNFAPLWRLVPQTAIWQTECKKAWDKLVAGDYLWAHVAMHLWPKRVVPKCTEDHSLAIAHGLEDVFWHENAEGKWQPNVVSPEHVDRLIAERTSPAVQDALKSLLEAQAPVRSRSRSARSGVPSKRAAATSGKVTSPGSSRQVPEVSEGDQSAAVLKLIASSESGASKSDVVTALGLTGSQWTAAIKALLGSGLVTQTGERRGARYHAQRGDT